MSALHSLFDTALFDAFHEKDPWPQSHHDLVDRYYATYDEQITSGEYQPFLYPWGTLGAAVVIAYLCIPHQNRPWLKNCRYLAFAWLVGFAAYSIMYTRARGMAPAFGVGLISAWSVAWVFAIMICNDAQVDFQRIERLEGVFGRSTKMPEKEKDSNDIVKGHAGPRDRHGEFAWQPYPLTPFIERLDWVLDIFCNFRGAGWNWRTSALPPPPKHIQEQLSRNSRGALPKTSNRVHSGQVALHPTLTELLRVNAKTFLSGYIILDALKTLMMHDPYFWGLMNRPPPPYLPFTLLPASPVFLHIYRQLISMLAVKHALQTLFSLAPLFFAGILRPRLLGARAEPWMYPSTWGSYAVVLDKGLAGWWSAWWHQTFRFAFQEPSKRVCEKLGWDRKSAKAKGVQLVIAFGASGVVHACGSFTCAGDTRPIRGPMAFFMLQAVGIFAEALGVQVLKKMGFANRIPRSARRVLTFAYVHVWFYFTAHLLCDDFARGGIWLFEPVPVSLFRGLGLGADKRDGWFHWGLESLRWHRGETWMASGVAF
jgi:hypothetical protein